MDSLEKEAMVRLDTIRHYTEVAYRAVRRQSQQVASEEPPKLEDGYLFAIALADSVRATRVAQKVLSSPELDAALAAFERAVPVAKDFRNLLEHWDAYLEGEGHRQAQLGIERGKHWFWWKSVSPAVLRIGGEKTGLDLSVSEAAEAATELYRATDEALRAARRRR
jgi:hypothetical protein